VKLLVVTDRLDPRGNNGSEIFATELCGRLERRHDLTVITRAAPAPGVLHAARVIVADDEATWPAERLGAFLRGRLRLDEPDLLYNLGGLLFGSRVAHGLGLLGCAAPLVNHFQALLGPYARHEGLDEDAQRAHAALQKSVSAAAALNVFPSLSELARAAREGYGSPFAGALVIPNGVSEEPFHSLAPATSDSGDRPWVLATAGRFSDSVKGADLVYRAFVELYRDRQDVRLLSIGNEPRFAEILRDLPADSYHLLEWLPRERFLATLATADAVVLPSRYEPFGMIAVEAMRLGLPVVATAVGGLREIVSHGETGLLSNLEDGSAGLYLALRELTADRAAARALGEAGRERARMHYSLDRVTGQVEQALRLAQLEARARPVREVLADRPAGGRP
jgi:glycosyltransferase involved in cell wall biosynthesis